MPVSYSSKAGQDGCRDESKGNGKGRMFGTCDGRSENGNMGTEDGCADLYDKSRSSTALTVGAHGIKKETEDDESEKNGRQERERE
jgi:hypothetical protein